MAAALAVAAGACSGAENPVPPHGGLSSIRSTAPHTAVTSASPATAPPATTGSTAAPTEQERVVEAYRRLWIEIVAANNPPDPDSPRLAEVATGDMLQKARQQIRSNKASGKGTRYANPSKFKIEATTVTLLTKDNAQVEGCMTDDLISIREADGFPLNTNVVARRFVATLEKADGAWRTSSNRYDHTFEGSETCE